MKHDDNLDGFDDDTPSADPSIRKDYEAALGEFLVAFNEIENAISDVIVLALKKDGRDEILNSMQTDTFSRKVRNLELISLRFPDAASRQLIQELDAIRKERNNLAHGHFDQNPFDGSYSIVNRQSQLQINRRKVTLEHIRSLKIRAEAVFEKLRISQSYFWFDPIKGED